MFVDSPRFRFAALGIGLCLLAVGAPQRSDAQYSAKQVSKMYGKAIKEAVKQCQTDFGDLIDSYCDQLDILQEDIDDGFVTASDVVGELIALTSDYYGMAYDAAEQTVAQIGGAAIGNLSLLNEGEPLPSAFIVGSCDATDDASESIAEGLEKFNATIQKKLKKFVKTNLKKNNLGLTVLVSAPEPPPVVPMPPPAPPVKPLKIDSSMGSELAGEGGDGQLCFSGQYDPANGTTVSVTINVPGVGDVTRNATLDPTRCRFRVCFGAGHGDDPLPAGTYQAEVDQIQGDEAFTAPDTHAGGVPTP